MTAPTAPAASRNERGAGRGQVVGESLTAKLRRWRPFILALGALLIVTVIGALIRPQHSKTPFAIDNPRQDGTQALAQLLRDEGVSVEAVHSPEAAAGAARSGGSGTTIALVNVGELSDREREDLARTGADIVVIGALYEDLSGLTDPDELTTSGRSASEDATLSPQCPDADAAAAASVAGSRGSVQINGDTGGEEAGVIGCFPIAQEDPEDGHTYAAYAVTTTRGGGTLRVIADATTVTNSRLTEAGHASLGMRVLGHHEHMVWFDASQRQAPTVWDTVSMPLWMPVLLLQGGVIICALAVVRGRRFGRIVVERLPVVVRATETTRGRGACTAARGTAIAPPSPCAPPLHCAWFASSVCLPAASAPLWLVPRPRQPGGRRGPSTRSCAAPFHPTTGPSRTWLFSSTDSRARFFHDEHSHHPCRGRLRLDAGRGRGLQGPRP